MTSMFGILNTGRLGLSASQSGLAVTGQNISNVNTTGYSRQQVELQSLGTGGVKLASVQRLRDDFLVGQMRDSSTRSTGADLLSTNLQNIEATMGSADDSTGLTQSFSNFFASLNDLTLQPSGTTERGAVVSQSEQLASSFNGLTDQLNSIRSQLDGQVVQTVATINQLTTGIAAINKRIGELGGANSQATGELNQILDQRDKLVDELSTYVPVRVLTDKQGGQTVFGAGEVLVEGTNQHDLTTVPNQANNGLQEVAITDTAGNTRSLNSKLTEGGLGALLQARDTYAKDALTQTEQLAAHFIRDVNQQHEAGTGLDGVSGRDLFTGLNVFSAPAWSNAGTASVSTSAITNPSQLTFDDYAIHFTGANQFDVVDKTTGTTVSGNNSYTTGSPINFAGISVTIQSGASGPAAGDEFAVNTYTGVCDRMDVSAAVKNDVRAIAAGNSSSAGDNRNALNLAAMRDAKKMGTPATLTYESNFNASRESIGMATKNAATGQANEQITQQQIKGMVDSVSGVSIDDESINIIQFQRAYEASSKVISATDELMQSLLQMVN